MNIIKWFGKPFLSVLLSACILLQLTACTNSAHRDKPTEGALYTAPAFHAAAWKGDDVHTQGAAEVDFSSVSEGYVAATYEGSAVAKIQIKNGDGVYNYNLNGEGVPEFFPLQMGDGNYTVRILTQISGTKYTPILEASREVVLSNEFAPFLVTSQFVNYDENSSCVALFYELTKDCETDIEVVTAVYEYVRDNITYDTERAVAVQEASGYVPDLDQVLQEKKGICFDYAALVAAMLRTGGIPTRMAFGYVSNGEVYHAWNLIYLEGHGWITIEMYIDANTWELIDLTFAAGMKDSDLAEYIGDGSNYAQVYVY